MGFEIDPSYKQVPERIADFKEKHPEGCLRPVDPSRPYWVETIGDKTYIVYAAAAYRTPDDPTPGVGIAWEPFPGKTPYTKDSELQNAETSAWGRAIVAGLASESKAIASVEDIRNRQEEQVPPAKQRVPQSVANRLTERMNTLPDEARAKCKGEFKAKFGTPAELTRGDSEAAEAMVAGYEVAAAASPEGKGDTTQPPLTGVADDQAGGVVDSPPANPPSQALRGKVHAAMADAGITDDMRHDWAEGVLGCPVASYGLLSSDDYRKLADHLERANA